MRKPELTHIEAIRNVGRLRRILEAVKLLNSTIDLSELTSRVVPEFPPRVCPLSPFY
jgi:hypothetical protein